jgi:hypothetical protein
MAAASGTVDCVQDRSYHAAARWRAACNRRAPAECSTDNTACNRAQHTSSLAAQRPLTGTGLRCSGRAQGADGRACQGTLRQASEALVAASEWTALYARGRRGIGKFACVLPTEAASPPPQAHLAAGLATMGRLLIDEACVNSEDCRKLGTGTFSSVTAPPG